MQLYLKPLAPCLAPCLALFAAAGVAAAAPVAATVDSAVSLVNIDTALTDDSLDAAVDGGGTVDLVLAGGAPAQAGVVSLSGTVVDPILRTVPSLFGPTTFDVPAGTIGFGLTSDGATLNPVVGGTFDQSDLDFALSGVIGGSVDLAGTVVPFTIDLATATLDEPPVLTGVAVTSLPDGSARFTIPLDLTLQALLSLGDPSGTPLGFDLSLGGVIVLNTAAVPEPAGLGVVGLGTLGLLRRRRH